MAETSFLDAITAAKIEAQEALGDDPMNANLVWCDDDGRPLTWPRDRRQSFVLRMRRIRVSHYLEVRKHRKPSKTKA